MGLRRREKHMSPEELRQEAEEFVRNARWEDMAVTPCVVPLDDECSLVRYRERIAALLHRQAESD